MDARAWNWTGVGRYIRALVREYAKLDHPHTFTLLMPDDADAIAQARELTQPQAEKFLFHIVGGSYYSWSEQLILPIKLANVEADLFHFPHFNVPLGFHQPCVVTIHDTTRFYFVGQKRQGLLQQLAYELVFMHAVRAARHVICVSEHTAHELLSLRVLSRRILPALRPVPAFPRQEAWAPSEFPRAGSPATVPPASETFVIYEGVDEKFSQSASQQDIMKVRTLIGTDAPYLLMVGVWMSHKNIPRTLQAFQKVRRKHPDLKLVITGKHQAGYVDVLALVADMGLRDAAILPGFVPDKLLPALYQQAQALLFASLYEGFGLPALEAAAAGTPVVASNISSLPEIMDGAAQYVNPESAEDIALGIQAVIDDEKNRQRLIAAGKQRAQTFSWEECAKETLQVYTVH